MPKTKTDRALLAPGLHVAPFLSRDGALVLLALDYGSELAYMATVTSVEGARSDELPGFSGRVLSMDVSRHFVPREDDDANVSQYMTDRLPRGVHLAPWRRWTKRDEWIAIDDAGRLVAAMRGESARRELSALIAE